VVHFLTLTLKLQVPDLTEISSALQRSARCPPLCSEPALDEDELAPADPPDWPPPLFADRLLRREERKLFLSRSIVLPAALP